MRGFNGRTANSQSWSDDAPLIDLLVDGELGEPERCELLKRLDELPDGWRRCALAFLEAQAWREATRLELTAVAAAPASAAVSPIVAPASNTKGRWKQVLATRPVLVLAATFLIAFLLGLYGRTSAPSNRTDAHIPAGPIAAGQPGDADSESSPESVGNAVQFEAVETTSGLAVAATPKPVGVLTWSVERGGVERQFAVPVVERSSIDDEWLHRQPPVVPAALRQAIESKGHRIVEHQKLMNLSLDDGRTVVVPISEVQVQLASRVYQ